VGGTPSTPAKLMAGWRWQAVHRKRCTFNYYSPERRTKVEGWEAMI